MVPDWALDKGGSGHRTGESDGGVMPSETVVKPTISVELTKTNGVNLINSVPVKSTH